MSENSAGDVLEADGSDLVGCLSEVSGRNATKEETAALVRQLREADQHKDQFLAALGHELRNPLASLRNALALLHDQGDVRGHEEALALAERQIKRLTRLVDDLLDLSRVAHGKVELHRERIDLAAIVGSAIESTRSTLNGRRHTLVLTLPSGPVWVDGDAGRLEQVFVNLLTNAAKFTPEGGRIGVIVERGEAEAVVRVTDTGIGLAPEMLPRIWGLYAQVAGGHSQGGLGIGLALVRELVELHRGSIRASSGGLGKGSEFVVWLPCAGEPLPSALSGTAVAFPSTARSVGILVVDDNRAGAESLAKLLRHWGHRVDLAGDGALALLAARATRPEVVLLDIDLPGMTGHDVARRLRDEADLGDTLLVALTGYGGEGEQEKSRQAGCDLHWVKPVDPNTLRDLLARVSSPGARRTALSRPLSAGA